PDELKQMAQKSQIRSFQDRGTLRFRIADIQELARRRGMTSDPELKLADPKTPKTPKQVEAPPSPSKKPAAPDGFSFAVDDGSDKVDIGGIVVQDSPSGSKKGPKSDGKRGKSPTPKPGSDSDVKLVPDGGLPVTVGGSDSDVKLVRHDSDVKSGS